MTETVTPTLRPETSMQITLASRPQGEPIEDDFGSREVALRPLEDGEVLLRTLYLSLDPYMRGRMSDAASYADPVPVGEVMVGGTVSEVIESRADDRRPGDVVLAGTGWQTYAIAPSEETTIVPGSELPLSTALGVLGMPGFTAYAGLLQIGRPAVGETVVVAAATGPVGSAVGQIARIKGARAVGIAGGAAKCRALIEEFGFDAAVDHRSPSFAADLRAAAPDGIDVYFENVGGPVTDAVIPLLNPFARMPVCGRVAVYNKTGPGAGPDRLDDFLRAILTRSLTVRGFIQTEFVEKHHDDFLREMTAWVAAGEVRYLEDVVDGLDQAPAAFCGLLAGRNFGKLLVRVGELDEAAIS